VLMKLIKLGVRSIKGPWVKLVVKI
jgi:hypothetical protein